MGRGVVIHNIEVLYFARNSGILTFLLSFTPPKKKRKTYMEYENLEQQTAPESTRGLFDFPEVSKNKTKKKKKI